MVMDANCPVVDAVEQELLAPTDLVVIELAAPLERRVRLGDEDRD